MKRSLIMLLFIVAAFKGYAQNENVGCSIWRRDVKTLTDYKSHEVQQLLASEPVPKTVHELINEEPPDPLTNKAKWEDEPRYHPSEDGLIRVKVKIQACKTEANDKDYHIILENPDDSTETMVAEIPSPDCPDIAHHPILVKRYTELREWFNENVRKPTSKLQPPHKPTELEIIGVPFWDGKHGGVVNGAAQNFREIHPVLNFVVDGKEVIAN